jgi:eukaryotic-like serine/threonine-protein kinase
MRLLAKAPEQRPPSARAVHGELMRMWEAEGSTEAWTAPYAFPTAQGEVEASAEAEPKGKEVAREASEPSPRPEEKAGSSGEARGGGGWPREGWKRALVVLALVLVLLGVGWRHARAACASALEAACSGAASTALALSAPSEKGRIPLLFSTPRFPGGLHALVCAAMSQLLACASAPVRPDMGGFLEQCPPEARMTASRWGFDKKRPPIVAVRLMNGTEVGTGEHTGLFNLQSGPMGGWMFLPEGGINWDTGEVKQVHWVTGEAKVFPDRVYIQFDQIYLDAVYPTQGRVPSPICGVAVNDFDKTEFGVRTFAASPDPGVKVDPAKVVYHGPDAAILNAPTVDTYVQLPGRRFPR